MVPISVSQALTVAEPQPGQVGSVLTCLMDVSHQVPAEPQYLRMQLHGPWAIQERFWSRGLLGCDGLQSEVFSSALSAHLCVLTAMPVPKLLSAGTCLAAAGKGYPCSTCNIVLNSIEQYQAHISGFKHKNQTWTLSEFLQPHNSLLEHCFWIQPFSPAPGQLLQPEERQDTCSVMEALQQSSSCAVPNSAMLKVSVYTQARRARMHLEAVSGKLLTWLQCAVAPLTAMPAEHCLQLAGFRALLTLSPFFPFSSFRSIRCPGCQEQCRLLDHSSPSSMSGRSQLPQEATVTSAKTSRASCSTVLGVVGGPRTHILCQPTMVSLSLWIIKALPSCMHPLSRTGTESVRKRIQLEETC
ncbi:zinc finger protein 346 isoform 2-T2 [Amazona ochrocephala]